MRRTLVAPGATGNRRARRWRKMCAVTETGSAARADTRARIEQAALELFRLKGFEHVTIDDVAAAAGISRRTFFRYFATKADAVWGDFRGHVARLERLLAAAGPGRPLVGGGRPPAPRRERLLAAAAPGRPMLAGICTAYVQVNDYAETDLPMLRQRLRLILDEPALVAHSHVGYAH